MSGGFIERHNLWSDEQKSRAADLKQRFKADNIRLVRVPGLIAMAVHAPRKSLHPYFLNH